MLSFIWKVGGLQRLPQFPVLLSLQCLFSCAGLLNLALSPRSSDILNPFNSVFSINAGRHALSRATLPPPRVAA